MILADIDFEALVLEIKDSVPDGFCGVYGLLINKFGFDLIVDNIIDVVCTLDDDIREICRVVSSYPNKVPGFIYVRFDNFLFRNKF